MKTFINIRATKAIYFEEFRKKKWYRRLLLSQIIDKQNDRQIAHHSFRSVSCISSGTYIPNFLIRCKIIINCIITWFLTLEPVFSVPLSSFNSWLVFTASNSGSFGFGSFDPVLDALKLCSAFSSLWRNLMILNMIMIVVSVVYIRLSYICIKLLNWDLNLTFNTSHAEYVFNFWKRK